jgi:hypothetical protein
MNKIYHLIAGIVALIYGLLGFPIFHTMLILGIDSHTQNVYLTLLSVFLNPFLYPELPFGTLPLFAFIPLLYSIAFVLAGLFLIYRYFE